MTKVLVTGGAGFIGSHVVEILIAKGYQVSVLDNLTTGTVGNLSDNLPSGKLRIVRGDIRDAVAVRQALVDADAVIHLAALIDTGYSVEKPAIVNHVNVGGTVTLLKESVDLKVRRFIFASSTAVYGDSDRLPLQEESEKKPISPYAVSKLAGEEYCKMYSRTFGLETVSLRFFNVYGLRQVNNGYAGVITKFIERVSHGQPPLIYGDGEQTRDFVHVTDVARACVLALEKGGLSQCSINVGTGKPTRITDLASLIINIFSASGLEPQYTPPKVGDIKENFADLTNASHMLGFAPRVSLREGLEELAENYISHLKSKATQQ